MRDAHKYDPAGRAIAIRSLRSANGLRAIEAFAASGQRMTLAEVAKNTGLTRAATRRYLLTLVANGYADFDGKRFQLTSRVLRLGHAYISIRAAPADRAAHRRGARPSHR